MVDPDEIRYEIENGKPLVVNVTKGEADCAVCGLDWGVNCEHTVRNLDKHSVATFTKCNVSYGR